MNRTKAGWGTYFTEPLPNIGLFLCRGNNKTARVFELAWYKYQQMQDAYEKSQPGNVCSVCIVVLSIQYTEVLLFQFAI